MLLERMCPSKNLAADVAEFDRMRQDDERKHLTWLVAAIDCLVEMERMAAVRPLQDSAQCCARSSLTNATGKRNKGAGKGDGGC